MIRQTKAERREFRRLYMKLDPGVRTRGTHVGGGKHADIKACFDAAMANNSHNLRRLWEMAELDKMRPLDKQRITQEEREHIDLKRDKSED